MSKLSLSRTRGKACPMTSTQIPQRERERRTDPETREEILFRRQMEAAIKQSLVGSEQKPGKNDDPLKSDDDESDPIEVAPKFEDEAATASEADTVILSSQGTTDGEYDVIKAKVANPAPVKSVVADDDDDEDDNDVVEVDDSDGSEFSPSPRKKTQKKSAPTKPKNAPKSKRGQAETEIALTTENSSKPEPKTNDSKIYDCPVPSTSGLKRARGAKARKKCDDDSDESDNDDFDDDDGSDGDFAPTKNKRQKKNQPKKPVSPPVKKSKAATAKKPETARLDPPPVAAKPEKHPANFQPTKLPAVKPSASVQPIKPRLAAAKPTLATARKTTEMKSAEVISSEPANTSSASAKISASTTPLTVRPVRALIPKWTPPAMLSKSSSSATTFSGSQTPSPGIGVRVGLSRNFKPPKPLHTSFKLPN